MADIEEVRGFLEKAKKLIQLGFFDFVPRKKNIDSIIRAGLTVEHVKGIISSLNYKNYCRGHVADVGRSRQGFVWEFGCSIDGIDFYIKLKIEERMGKECLVCISFHTAEYPLRYPYINGRR